MRFRIERPFTVAAMFVAVLVSLTTLVGAQMRRATPASGRAPAASGKAKSFTVVEATIPEMRAALEQGRTTSHEIVRQYLTRIGTYEDKLHAAITVNPHALDEADARDRERAQGNIRGPLHGIPIALKDNIQTTDMRTTGGALAFEGLVPPYEAT
jgi:amidase